jgi:hypothetical protein
MPEKDGATTPRLCLLEIIPAPLPTQSDDAIVGDPRAPVHTVQCLFQATHAMTLQVRGRTPDDVARVAVEEAAMQPHWKALDEHSPIWINRIVLGNHETAYAIGAQVVPVPPAYTEAATAATAVALDMGATLLQALAILSSLKAGKVPSQAAVGEAIDLIKGTLDTYAISRDAAYNDTECATTLPAPFGQPVLVSRTTSNQAVAHHLVPSV